MKVLVHASHHFDPTEYGTQESWLQAEGPIGGGKMALWVEDDAAYQQLLHDFGRRNVSVEHGSFHEGDIYQDIIDFEDEVVLCLENVLGGGVRYAVYDETLRDVGQIQLPVPVAVRAARAVIKWAEEKGLA